MAARCFWHRGYAATSVKDLVEATGITAASLYNAFSDKRTLFRAALDHYVESSVGERIRRCDALLGRSAIATFFGDILDRSLNDRDRKGCLLVNSALEIAPHDPQFQKIISDVLRRIEKFFLKCVRAGQTDGTITRSVPAHILARDLLAVLMGVRVLARVRPEKALLEGIVESALARLDEPDQKSSALPA
ncbi:MAG TPA: TetR/AcrR family transcriptional regulator [Steroidobacteraceae bacterium]|nr:TetR/AcrR family transcriptional regulator [Steroidobacteraceae bacterium]